MEPKTVVLLFSLFILIQLNSIANAKENASTEKTSAPTKDGKLHLSTAELYAKLFRERRKEHQLTAKKMLGAPYEKNYKLLNLAYPKIFQVINESNSTLVETKYVSSQGFPIEDDKQQEALILLIENCCIAGELVLHFPEISYKVFRKAGLNNWKPTLNWCNTFIFGFPHIIDEPTVTMMGLLQQEINEELRGDTYVNPYYAERETTVKRKKPRAKLKKGPQLNGRNEL